MKEGKRKEENENGEGERRSGTEGGIKERRKEWRKEEREK